MKTLLVTGASRGIGREIAKQGANLGYNIVINYNKSQKEAEELYSELEKKTGVLLVKCDVGNVDDVERLFSEAEKRFGKITHIVNNAGISWTGLLSDMQECQYDALIDTNIKGIINVTKRAIPNMVERKEGVIVNISSIWGKTGASCEAVYSATKGAVISFTKAMSRELGPSGIRVNAICPGCILTDMLNNLSDDDKNALKEDISLNRLGTPKDIANVCMFLLSDDSSYITGQSLVVDGGFID